MIIKKNIFLVNTRYFKTLNKKTSFYNFCFPKINLKSTFKVSLKKKIKTTPKVGFKKKKKYRCKKKNKY
jgi:hypothetical protein